MKHCTNRIIPSQQGKEFHVYWGTTVCLSILSPSAHLMLGAMIIPTCVHTVELEGMFFKGAGIFFFLLGAEPYYNCRFPQNGANGEGWADPMLPLVQNWVEGVLCAGYQRNVDSLRLQGGCWDSQQQRLWKHRETSKLGRELLPGPPQFPFQANSVLCLVEMTSLLFLGSLLSY